VTAEEILDFMMKDERIYNEVCVLLLQPSFVPTSLCISALQELGHDDLMAAIRELLPEGYILYETEKTQ